ncbi:MAG: iron dependent repressor, metal binding and dimerization domain protein [Planctomycetia bacterium]|nr:iron dependent repressor, metal binding and dimerization domain protein [Planctomycetia bacterium]
MTAGVITELTESLEDYLEAIYLIIQEKQVARPKDIASQMKVTNASVTGALRTLAERELIHYAPYDYVTFTPKGHEVAEEIYSRHVQLKTFLRDFLGVEDKRAGEVACRMEHAISRDILDKLVRFATFVQNCPRGGHLWLSNFEQGCDQDADYVRCQQCVETLVTRVNVQGEQGTAEKSSERTLDTFLTGERGRVLRLEVDEKVLSRVTEMGITSGTLVEVEGAAPWGDPMDIRVNGNPFSLWKDEARGIVLQVLPQQESENR